MAYGLKFPLSLSAETGDLDKITDIKEEIKQNIKLLFLTRPGEKLLDPLYGIGIERFLFEVSGKDDQQEIVSIISSQIDKYMSFVSVDDIRFNTAEEENARYLTVIYSVPSLGIIAENLLFESEAGLATG